MKTYAIGLPRSPAVGTAVALAAALTLAACASTKPPPADLAVARASITQAESAGAADFASDDLALARHKLDVAELDVKDKKYDEAQREAAEATVDADLAGRKARAGKEQRAANEIQRSNALLNQENVPPPAGQ